MLLTSLILQSTIRADGAVWERETTLLDVLAGRKTAGRTTGSILFAGVPPTVTFLRRYTGYVEQFGEQQLARTLLPDK